MCGTVMRGADALPGSKATSRAKGSLRNLGDLVSGRRRRVPCVYGGPPTEGSAASCRKEISRTNGVSASPIARADLEGQHACKLTPPVTLRVIEGLSIILSPIWNL